MSTTNKSETTPYILGNASHQYEVEEKKIANMKKIDMREILLNKLNVKIKYSKAELLKKQEEIVMRHRPHTPTYDSEKEEDLNEEHLEQGPLRTIRTLKNIKNYSKITVVDKKNMKNDKPFVQCPLGKIQALEYQLYQKNSIEATEANLVQQNKQSIKNNVNKEWIIDKVAIICNALPNNAFSSYCYLENLRKEKEIRQQKCERGYENVDEFLGRFPN